MRSKLEILVNGLAAGLEIQIPGGPILAIRNVAAETAAAVSGEPRYAPTLVQKLTRCSSASGSTPQELLTILDLSVNDLIQLAEHFTEADIAGIAANLSLTSRRALDASREQTGLTPAIKRTGPPEIVPAPQAA